MEHKEAWVLRELLQRVVWRHLSANSSEVGRAANAMLAAFERGERETEFHYETGDDGSREAERLEIRHYAEDYVRMRCRQVLMCQADCLRVWGREMFAAFAAPME